MTPDPSLAKIEQLDSALASLEAAVARVGAFERGRANLSHMLAVMDDDRQRLAAELDSALARAGRLDAAAETVAGRLRAVDDRVAALLRSDDG